MKTVKLYYKDGVVSFKPPLKNQYADATLMLDEHAMTDNTAVIALAEALEHFTTQNQFPPVNAL